MATTAFETAEVVSHDNFHKRNSSSSMESSGTTTSSTSSGITTLELHPNVILGIPEDDDSSGGGGPDRPHMCTICHASYKTKTHLRRHMFIHMSSRPFPCPECGKGFNRKEHLNKHLEAVHSGTKHHCPYCGKEISRMDHLKRHINNMHGDVLKADSNEKAAVLKVQLKYGQRQKTQLSFLTPNFPVGTIGQTIITPIPTTTTASGKSFHNQNEPSSSDADTATSMTIIPSNILGPGQGVATLAIQSTPTQKVLVHQRLPSGSNVNFATATNGLSSLAKLSLSLGQNPLNAAHSGEKKMLLQIFNCGECCATFTTEKDLSAHARMHKPQPYRCPDCPRAYTRREKLTEHIRCVHQGQKFSCEYCNKELSRKDHVLRHIRSVHPEVYAASFAEMDDGHLMLDDQGRMVSSNTSFPITSASGNKRRKGTNSSSVSMPIGDFGVLLRSVCNICLKVFGTAYHLTRHIESCHSGDVRPFSCNACNKMFKRKDHLTKHVKSHCPRLKEDGNGNTMPQNQSFQTAQPTVKHRVDNTENKDVVQMQVQAEQKNLGIISDESLSSGTTDCHRAILEKLQVEMDGASTRAGGGRLSSPNSLPHLQEPVVRTDQAEEKGNSEEESNEFSLAVIDSFMQGNVNVVVVDEEISNFLQQSSNSQITTTFPCGQCQKEFPARDQLIAHLQEHASESVMHADQHISDISFSDF